MPPVYNILVLNGPNLNVLGIRQPDIYGTAGLDAIPDMVARVLGQRANQAALHFYQSNSEGALIDRLELARGEGMHGLAVNAGAYTHTSLALADCLAWINIPAVEVHVSNVFARPEHIRRKSFIAAHAIGVISGFGILGYALAVQALLEHLTARTRE